MSKRIEDKRLLPCPFCGGKFWFVQTIHGYYNMVHDRKNIHCPVPRVFDVGTGIDRAVSNMNIRSIPGKCKYKHDCKECAFRDLYAVQKPCVSCQHNRSDSSTCNFKRRKSDAYILGELHAQGIRTGCIGSKEKKLLITGWRKKNEWS